jgi:MarR family transcriptional regulator, lower aerobic nicotinate degradation pathway regulator
LEPALPPQDSLTSPLDGFAVEDHVGFLLRRAHQRHVSLFSAGMPKGELTPTQFTALLKSVEMGRVTQNHLGRLAAMDPATVQGVVRRLIARGLMRRGRDPMDRRMAVLEATEAGVALIARLVPCARGSHDAALAPLSSDERVRLIAMLRKLG